MTKAILIRTDGTISDICPTDGAHFTLEEAQEYVGGWVELIDLPEDKIMLVNEEGAYHCQCNLMATVYCQHERVLMPGTCIYGDVVVCDSKMFE